MAATPTFKVLFSEEELAGEASSPALKPTAENIAAPASTPSTPSEGWTECQTNHVSRQVGANTAKPNSMVQFPDASASADSSDSDELNAHLNENFKNQSNSHRRPEPAIHDQSQTVKKFHSNILSNYVDWLLQKHEPSSWLNCPEVPTAKELMDQNEPWTQLRTLEDGSEEVVIGGNVLHGTWKDANTYLATHYTMLREEAVQPLRLSIAWVKAFPSYSEDLNTSGGIGIYSKVHITSLTFSTRGLGVRVVFSLEKVGKNIRWEQSKRLVAGSLVALTPTKDMFKTTCIVAVVAARPLDMLTQQDMPPMVDLFFGDPNTLDIDPTIEYTMVEDRSSFFEAVRHIGVSLQRMTAETFPLRKHIVKANTNVAPPEYIKNQPKLDLSTVFQPAKEGEPLNVDILEQWPKNPTTSLDKSQTDALHAVLKRRVALIQGPPGTGKTHVSAKALEVLTKNMGPEDPPIIVACQTNHAVDQLLRHVAKFEENFARLGGRSKDTGIVKERTLYNLRQKKENRYKIPGGMHLSARKFLARLEEQMSEAMAPLEYGKDHTTMSFLNLELYRKAGVLTQKQCDKIEKGDQNWAGPSGGDRTPLAKWLGKSLQRNERYYQPDKLGGFEFEDVDLEFEQLKELEAENVCQDDVGKDFESLPGNGFSIFLPMSGNRSSVGEEQIEHWLKKDDLWSVPEKHRGAVFNYFQRKVIISINERVRHLAARYYEEVVRFRYGGFENNAILLRQQKVIGVTTTGLSKYRGLIAALCPRVIMIEEAAETMEAPVTAGCVPSVEHLILVGDHKQLRPQCGVKSLEAAPFHLNVSMFERLVNNNLPYKMLKRQRRMIPEIRRLLGPIYKNDIKDHVTMRDLNVRPPVPGMGGINSFFYTHSWADATDDNKSSINVQEAEMIVGLYDHLISNGLSKNEITILTFYNGQRKLLLRKLRDHPRMKRMDNGQKQAFKVLTVDSYQGEENEVILLSLVKSNSEGKIGFTGVENRVCVALSRAKRGFYMFGNAELLVSESKLWAKIINILLADTSVFEDDRNPANEPFGRVVFRVPVRCTNHNEKMYIEHIADWDKINGGCEKPCEGTLSCGHKCSLNCHPFGHDKAVCFEDCDKMLPCGHKCSNECYDICSCLMCNTTRPRLTPMGSDTDMWIEFAAGGVQQHDAMLKEMQRERYLEQQAQSLSAKAIEQVAVEAKVTPPRATNPALSTPREPMISLLKPNGATLVRSSPATPVLVANEANPAQVSSTPPRKTKSSHSALLKSSIPSPLPITIYPRRPLVTPSATNYEMPVGYTGAPTRTTVRQVQNLPLLNNVPAPSKASPVKVDEAPAGGEEEWLIDLS